MKQAYLISNIEEYGKLMAFCIEKDICVFRTFWDERKKGIRCFYINWEEKRCYYSDKSFWEDNGYRIVSPEFYVNEYGVFRIKS